MIEIVSAGGVVYKENTILMLQKKNGDWVLPKGRIEKGETLEITALREVKEETNVDAVILDYIGNTTYKFSNYWTHYKVVSKTVSWYLMQAKNYDLIPLRAEGFTNAKFLPTKMASKCAKYNDERKIIDKAIEAMHINNYNLR